MRFNNKVQIDFGDAKEFDDSVYRFTPNPRHSRAIRETGEFNFDIDLLDRKESNFVGTPLYVSPEMLTDCKALPASDLWALGIMIFRMHTGKFPFNSPVEQNLFQKILSLDYEWPADLVIHHETKDLVERLLKLNPQDRLGAGSPGSPNDLNQLIKHPYFSGIDLNNLQTMKVPLTLQQNWIEEFEIIDHLIPQKGNYDIVREGLLEKRNKVFVKKMRHFVLHKNGQLNYYCDGNPMGTIELSKQTTLLGKSDLQFNLVNLGRTYFLFSR